jgi:hypothetical protein
MENSKRIPYFEEVLKRRGYYISPNFGLIFEKEGDENPIAEIRAYEKTVILPYWNKEEMKSEKISRLKKILKEEEIPTKTFWKSLFG